MMQSDRTSGNRRFGQIYPALLLFFVVLGTALVLISYKSVEPLVLAVFYYALLRTGLRLSGGNTTEDSRLLNLVFAAGWAASGIGAFYLQVFDDFYQIESDIGGFFELASSEQPITDLLLLSYITEGALAVLVWQKVYYFFDVLGFEREHYIGVSLNMTAMTISALLCSKMIQNIYGYDRERIRRFAFLFATCGLFGMMAGLHLRDAIVVLAVTILSYGWVRFLSEASSVKALLIMTSLTLLISITLGYLRAEFVYFPAIYFLAAVFSFRKEDMSRGVRILSPLLAVIILGALAVATVLFASEMQLLVTTRREAYVQLSQDTFGAGSLSLQLLVNQPLPIRIPMGFVYLFIMPLPMWVGFFEPSALHLFRSLNTVSFYVIGAMLLASLSVYIRDKSLRQAPLTFLILSGIIVISGICATSLEVRHLGSVLPGILVFGVMLDFNDRSHRKAFRTWLIIVLGGVIGLHLLWMGAKVL